MTITEIIELTQILLSSLALTASSYHDYKERRVPDTIPKILIPTATILTLIEIFTQPDFQLKLTTYIIDVAITTIIFLAIAHIGLFGGADAKIMIGISMSVPWQPKIVKPLLNISFPILPITILNNSLILAALTLPYAAASNLLWKKRTGMSLFSNLEKESSLKKMAALLFCIKKEKTKIKPYDMIAEDQGKLTIFNQIQEDDLTPEQIQSLPENVFVTYSLPLIIFIALGFLTTILVGDVPLYLVKTMLGI